MQPGQFKNVEAIQRMVARTVATHPSGRNLLLIGGFRYRLLDRSVRMSNDIDYHWEGDLDQKQLDLIESVFFALDFENPRERQEGRNLEWMQQFRVWARSPSFRRFFCAGGRSAG